MTRILIQTLDIRSGNYGCALQALALQATVRKLGHDAVTVLTRRHYSMAGVPLSEKSYKFINKVLPKRFVRSRYINEGRRAPFEEFINRNVSTHISSLPPSPSDLKALNNFGAYIVGSDQVWREEYAEIPSNLFNYVTSTDPKLISYAASFGRDDFSLSELKVLQKYSSLASRFRAVSVREKSGVAICEKVWGQKAVHVIDPTLLLEPEDYRAIVATSPPPNNFDGPGVFEYVLDKTDRTAAYSNQIMSLLGLDSSALVKYATDEDHDKSHQQKRAIRVPSVEEWINNIDKASFVVTDSFHGCCFAILFNKPFIALGNPERGQARFTSLLSIFGLEHRLVSSPEDLPALVKEEIKWDEVNAALVHERSRGLSFLEKKLD